MLVILVAFGFVALAFWQRSYFLQIVGAVVATAFGIYWMGTDPSFIYIIEGMVAVAIGLYMLIMVGVDLIKGR